MVDGGGETPGPIPNPEAKPARADGTAPGREWESRLPPTQQLHTSTRYTTPPLCSGCFSYAWPEPTWLDSALRTTTAPPIIGAHPPIPRPGLTPHCGQPVRNRPAGRDLPTRGHIGRGASTRSHDDAYCGAKVEYRTSSTPAYTDELGLHHSTNNTPTTTRGRARLRIADNTRYTNYWRLPTKARFQATVRIADNRGDTTRQGAICQLGAT